MKKKIIFYMLIVVTLLIMIILTCYSKKLIILNKIYQKNNISFFENYEYHFKEEYKYLRENHKANLVTDVYHRNKTTKMYNYSNDSLETIDYKDEDEAFSINLINNEKSTYNEEFLKTIYNEFPFRKLNINEISINENGDYYVVNYLNAKYYFNKENYIFEKETLVDNEEEFSIRSFTFEINNVSDEKILKP